MPRFSIDDMMAIGSTQGLSPSFLATGVSTDSRTVRSGDVFFALQGGRFDGHDYIADVFEKGAAVCVVSNQWRTRHSSMNGPFVVVNDTLNALQMFAGLHRSKYTGPLVAITGTNGKTTCKEMTAAVLSTKYRTISTEGNLNNEIGLPLTLLRIEPDTQMVVAEMGADKQGDIAVLCEIARPTHGVVTNIGHAHLHSFGSLDIITKTKTELFASVADHGVCFINMDDMRLAPFARTLPKCVTFGLENNASYCGKIESVNASAAVRLNIVPPQGNMYTIQLRVPGIHQAGNALMAAAIGQELGVAVEQIQTILASYVSKNSRMSVINVRGLVIIDDTYNANPESTKAAIDTLMKIGTQGRRIVVLSDMLELGNDSVEQHRSLGFHLLSRQPDAVFLTGKEAAEMYAAAQSLPTIRYFGSQDALIDSLRTYVRPGDTVLVKGSRGTKMENVVKAL